MRLVVDQYGEPHCHFMGELTAQVRIPKCSNCKTWYENAQVCGMPECHKRFRFRTRFLQLENSEIPT